MILNIAEPAPSASIDRIGTEGSTRRADFDWSALALQVHCCYLIPFVMLTNPVTAVPDIDLAPIH